MSIARAVLAQACVKETTVRATHTPHPRRPTTAAFRVINGTVHLDSSNVAAAHLRDFAFGLDLAFGGGPGRR